MKKFFLFLPFFLFIQLMFANHEVNNFLVDTLKTPEGKQLTRKQKRLEGRAVQGSDYTLSTTKKKADELFGNLGYMSAVTYYEKLEGVELNGFVMSKMANSFRLNGNYEMAEFWFSQMINEVTNPEDYLHYAEVLQANDKCEDATRWYSEYISKTMDTTRDVITDCTQLENIKSHQNVEVKNILDLNSSGLDFSPISYQDGIVFTSNRGVEKLTKKRDKWTKDNFTDLFFAKMSNNGGIEKITPFESEINDKLHDGTATFHSSGAMMIFSRSDADGENKEGIKELQLCSSNYKDGNWSEAQTLTINSSNFASCHPALSSDNRRLYFASNRPGGYGGMDIWMSEKNGNSWGSPINLGPTVNTSGNEVFPFISKSNKLFFASNGHRGLGGLDIFSMEQTIENDDRTWAVRENLGEPFNSNKDDFGFTMQFDEKSGYFTSSREGGQGRDDIYSWAGELNMDDLISEIMVLDEETKEQLTGVNVKVSKGNSIEKMPFSTNKVGKFNMEVEPQNSYIFMINEEGYEPLEVEVSSVDLLNGKGNILPLKRPSSILLEGVVINRKYNKGIPNAAVWIQSKCTGVSQEIATKSNGEFNIRVDCDCEYELTGEKANFLPAKTILNTIDKECNKSNLRPIKVIIELDLKEHEMPKKFATRTGGSTDSSLNFYFLGNDDYDFREGQVIRLSNLYYDFNKANIRRDAKIDLNKIYDLLMTYPTMKIALMSHTDARGKNEYNQRLSQKRAISARDFLINRGIAPHRVSGEGLGETMPVNHCRDGMDCDEDQHQLNRRTEVKITAFNQQGVRVDGRK